MRGSRAVSAGKLLPGILIFGVFLLQGPPAAAGAIALDTWFEFGFTDAGVLATGGDPADPAGPFLIPSSGTPTVFLDAPPWTVVAPASGLVLTVTDSFTEGDQFEVFDFGVSLGITSVPVGNADSGDDPVVSLADPNISKGLFALGAGAHSITIVPTLSPDGLGAGYLLVAAASAPVPEPASLLLVALGAAAIGLRARKRAGIVA